jgi:hypothetical protein
MRFFASGFSWINFPQAPDYNISDNSNFVENSQSYSQVKVHHQVVDTGGHIFPE